jgi:transcription initiation factor TFIIB
MQLNEMTSRQAMGIMHNAMKSEASTGKNPMGLAAAVLYISYHNNNIKNSAQRKSNDSDDKRTQTSFAHASGITDVTLRNTVRNLKNQLLLLN